MQVWNAGHADTKQPGSRSSLDHGSFYGIQGFTSLILGQLLHILEEGTAAELVLHQEMLVPLSFSAKSSQVSEKPPCLRGPHCHSQNRSLERSRSRRLEDAC